MPTMKPFLRVLVASGPLVACGVPNVSDELAATGTSLGAIERTAVPALRLAAQRERRDAVTKRVTELKAPYRLGPGCGLVRGGDLSGAHSCDLVPIDTLPTGPMNATLVALSYDALTQYQAGLEDLAKADDVAAVRAEAARLVAGVAGLSGAVDPTSNAPTAAASTAPRVGALFGLALDQYRIAVLRRTVRQADPVIGKITADVLAWYASQDGSLQRIAAGLIDANDAVIAARNSGSPSRHGAAIRQLEAQNAAFQAAWETSPARAFAGYRADHAALLARLSHEVRTEDLDAPLGDLETLTAE